MHPLDLGVFGQSGMPQFPPDARLLIAAEGAEIAKGMIVVDPDRAGADLFGNSFRPGRAAGKYAAGQAVQNMNLMFGFDEREGLLS
jgi:hypothetical protein